MSTGTRHDVDMTAWIDGLMRDWLPIGFAFRVALATEAWPAHDEERAMVAGAVPRRRAEFVTGRWCAHEALREVGRPIDVLHPGPLGALLWPSGSIGSITHEHGVCCAAAGVPGPNDLGIGIDLCAADSRSLAAIEQRLWSDEERSRRCGSANEVVPRRAVFCAKEAVVKAISRIAARYLDLRDITLTGSHDAYTARVAGLDLRITGRHASAPGRCLAMAVAHGFDGSVPKHT